MASFAVLRPGFPDKGAENARFHCGHSRPNAPSASGGAPLADQTLTMSDRRSG